MFSLDSTTPETLMKVRGVDKLAKIEAAVFRLLRIRGDRELPRVGVSITIQNTNRHEADEFVERWVGIVDVVRTGIVFENGTFPDMVEPPKRVPCAVIYKTMPVHNDGSVRLCCLDGVRATDMGNVFEHEVEEIWQGEEFAKARYYHETEQWDKVPFCKGCNGWAQYEYSEEVRDGLLIRKFAGVRLLQPDRSAFELERQSSRRPQASARGVGVRRFPAMFSGAPACAGWYAQWRASLKSTRSPGMGRTRVVK